MVPQNPAAVNEINFELPPAPEWNPAQWRLPDDFLETSAYEPDDPERLRWKALRRLLPEGRQARIGKCGKEALHLVKTGRAGSYETVQPLSCMDKTACPYCASRYASEMVLERLLKLGQICAAHKAALAFVEARATIPTWNAAVRAEGCPRSEERGRLCTPGTHCHLCDGARSQHRRAADIEARLQRALTQAWLRLSPHSGGCYVTGLEVDHHGSITLVVRLLVPSVAVACTPVDAIRTSFTQVDLTALSAIWSAACTRLDATFTSLTAGSFDTHDEIIAALVVAHEPALARLERAAVEGTVTQSAVRTFARAGGLSTVGPSGKIRRVQRTAWFGAFSGRNQTRVLAALGIEIRKADREAVQTVKDHYRVLGLSPEYIEVQSLLSGEKKSIPRQLWRASSVDPNGNPLTPPDMAAWEVVTGRNYQAELIRYARLLNASGNMRLIAPRSDRELRRAQEDVWGASMGITRDSNAVRGAVVPMLPVA